MVSSNSQKDCMSMKKKKIAHKVVLPHSSQSSPICLGGYNKIPHTGDKAHLDNADSSTDTKNPARKAKFAEEKKTFFLPE